jgi:hypothetical protein
METIAAVHELQNEVRRRMADATLTIDPPAAATGRWWVDVQRYGRVASVQYKAGEGYGVAAPYGGYGEGVDVVVHDASAAAEHVARALEQSSIASGLPPALGADDVQRQLIVTLAAHIARIVGETVQETIAKMIEDLRRDVANSSEDVRRIERALSRAADEVLSERNRSSATLHE